MTGFKRNTNVPQITLNEVVTTVTVTTVLTLTKYMKNNVLHALVKSLFCLNLAKP